MRRNGSDRCAAAGGAALPVRSLISAGRAAALDLPQRWRALESGAAGGAGAGRAGAGSPCPTATRYGHAGRVHHLAHRGADGASRRSPSVFLDNLALTGRGEPLRGVHRFRAGRLSRPAASPGGIAGSAVRRGQSGSSEALVRVHPLVFTRLLVHLCRGAQRQLAGDDQGRGDLRQLQRLALAVAVHDLQALALRRQVGAAAVGRHDQRRERDREEIVAVCGSPCCRWCTGLTRRCWRCPGPWRGTGPRGRWPDARRCWRNW
jgi:hypothetical protein